MLPTNFDPLQTPKEKLQAQKQPPESSGWGTAAALGGLALASPLLYKGTKKAWQAADRPFREYLEPLKKFDDTMSYLYAKTLKRPVNAIKESFVDLEDNAVKAKAYENTYRKLNAPTFDNPKDHYELATNLATTHAEAQKLNPKATADLQKKYIKLVDALATNAANTPWAFKNATLTKEQQGPFNEFLNSQKSLLDMAEASDQELFNAGISPDIVRFMVQQTGANPEHMDELLSNMRKAKNKKPK